MRRPFLAALLCLGAAAALAQLPAPAAAPDDATLLRQLRDGGLVLYIRHAATDFSQDDSKMTSYEDCPTQRNLTDAGRATARRVGEAIAKLGVPVGRVLASPFCRTMETARLVFGKAERSTDVRGGPLKSDDPKRYDGLRRLLSAAPAKGTNLAISSHGNPFYGVTGPPYLSEGEIAVVRPKGREGFEVVARLRPEDWERLAR